MREAADRALTRPRPRAAGRPGRRWSRWSPSAPRRSGRSGRRPPAARDAPAGEFSAARAFQQVQAIAAEPHVAGSAANDRVREHLLGTLRGLGPEPGGAGHRLGAGRRAVVQRRRRRPGPGTQRGRADPRHRLHRPGLPGRALRLGADRAGRATTTAPASSAILETARALTAGPRLRNDVVLVLTDAEEACLCGAKAFVDQHPLARRRRRGAQPGGPRQQRPGDHVRDARRTTPSWSTCSPARPSRWARRSRSRSTGCCRTTPTSPPFREAGFRGLNTAYIDGAARLPRADRHAVRDGPGQPAAPRRQRARAGPRVRRHATWARWRRAATPPTSRCPAGWSATPAGWSGRSPCWPCSPCSLLAGLARRRGLVSGGRLTGGFLLALVPIVAGAAGRAGLLDAAGADPAGVRRAADRPVPSTVVPPGRRWP